METPITSNDMGDGDGGINHRDFALSFILFIYFLNFLCVYKIFFNFIFKLYIIVLVLPNKHKLHISFHVSDQIAISLSLLDIKQ